MTLEQATGHILKVPGPKSRQKLLTALKESLSVPDEQSLSGFRYGSADLAIRHGISPATLRRNGICITREDASELLQGFGYRPSRIDVSMQMSGKRYRHLFERSPLKDGRTYIYTWGEAVYLLRRHYRSLHTTGKDTLSTLGYADESTMYAPTSTIVVADVLDELGSYLQKHPEELYVLNPRTLERIIASVFRNQGYDVDLTPPTKDGGYDLLAVQHSEFTGSQVYLIECKRYAPKHKVGVGVVRGLYGVVCCRDATKGIVVTTSSFTRGAQEFAEKHLARLSLRDFDSLRNWLGTLQESPPEAHKQ